MRIPAVRRNSRGSSSEKAWLGQFLETVAGMETSSGEMGLGGGTASYPQEPRSQERKGQSNRAQVLSQS